MRINAQINVKGYGQPIELKNVKAMTQTAYKAARFLFGDNRNEYIKIRLPDTGQTFYVDKLKLQKKHFVLHANFEEKDVNGIIENIRTSKREAITVVPSSKGQKAPGLTEMKSFDENVATLDGFINNPPIGYDAKQAHRIEQNTQAVKILNQIYTATNPTPLIKKLTVQENPALRTALLGVFDENQAMQKLDNKDLNLLLKCLSPDRRQTDETQKNDHPFNLTQAKGYSGSSPSNASGGVSSNNSTASLSPFVDTTPQAVLSNKVNQLKELVVTNPPPLEADHLGEEILKNILDRSPENPLSEPDVKSAMLFGGKDVHDFLKKLIRDRPVPENVDLDSFRGKRDADLATLKAISPSNAEEKIWNQIEVNIADYELRDEHTGETDAGQYRGLITELVGRNVDELKDILENWKKIQEDKITANSSEQDPTKKEKLNQEIVNVKSAIEAIGLIISLKEDK